MAFKELADVEEEGEAKEGADVADDPVLVGGGVLLAPGPGSIFCQYSVNILSCPH